MSARKTRQKILDAAQHLIETGGFTRLTTRQIAEQAGVAEGTIFKHFKRKEDLALAVVIENSPKFREALANKRAGQGSVRKNLEDIALAIIRFSDKLVPLAAALFADSELLERHRQVLNETGRGPKDAFDLIGAYVAEEQKLGRVNHNVAPLSVQRTPLGSLLLLGIPAAGTGPKRAAHKRQQYATRLVGTLMRGLSASKRD